MNQSKSIKSEAGEREARNLVIAVSLAIPVVVTFLYFMKKLVITEGPLKDFLDQLPLVNASVNGLTAVLLIAAFVAIKNKLAES